MNILHHVTLKTRLILMSASFGVLMLILGLMTIYATDNAVDEMQHLFDNRLMPTARLSQVQEHMLSARAEVLLGLQHDPANPEIAAMHDHPVTKHIDAAQADTNRVDQLLGEINTAAMDEEELGIFNTFKKGYDTYVHQGIEPALAALKAGSYKDAENILLKNINPSYGPAKEALDTLIDVHFIRQAQQDHDVARVHAVTVQELAIALLVIAIGFNSLLAFFTIRDLAKSVGEIDRTMTSLADGTLTARADYRAKDELGHIASGLNNMGDRFQKVIRDLSEAANQLASAAEETSAVTRETNQNISQQQHEVEQVATAMNEMNATVHEVAKNAASAANAAHNADEQATNGKRVVDTTVGVIENLAEEVNGSAEAIRSLAQESESIGSVLDVIRGVAEQTNLLALNAAIEAARAGTHGRGFAVVADEVRTLAQRTQKSTQEIQDMIERLQKGTATAVGAMEKSQGQAHAGVQQAIEAGTSLDAIKQAVDAITEMNTQIASAAEEQSAVAEEINRNINNISQVAEQSASGAQQTAAASEELARLAEQMQSTVVQFKV